jgi:hypothetical protein
MTVKRGQIRISLIHRHPWTKQAKVVVSQWTGVGWQLVKSSLDKSEVTDPAIVSFLAWARYRYPNALLQEK